MRIYTPTPPPPFIPPPPPPLLHSAMRLLVTLLSLSTPLISAQVCRLSIPNSGGASQRPVVPASPPVAGVTYALVPSDGPPPLCAGPAGCEAACCAVDACFAWGWTVAGSAHQPCGGTECDLLLLAAPSAWTAAALQLQLAGGYNVAGFIFSNSSGKQGCCGGAPAPASTASAAPLAATASASSASPTASASLTSSTPTAAPHVGEGLPKSPPSSGAAASSLGSLTLALVLILLPAAC